MAGNSELELFPIREINGEATMKNISPTSLLHFHGLNFEELTPSYLDMLYSLGNMIIPLMSIELNFFLPPSRMKPCTSS